MKTTIGFIGGGRITKIFLQGFKNAGLEFESVKVFEPNGETLEKLTAVFPQIEKAEDLAAAASQQIVFLAVHPAGYDGNAAKHKGFGEQKFSGNFAGAKNHARKKWHPFCQRKN